MRSRKTEM